MQWWIYILRTPFLPTGVTFMFSLNRTAGRNLRQEKGPWNIKQIIKRCQLFIILNETKYSRMDQVKFVEDSLLKKNSQKNFTQISLGPFLNICPKFD